MTAYQQESQAENDEDRHFLFVGHVHLPQCRNDDQQNDQVRRDVEDGLHDFIVEVRGAVLLRRGNGKVSGKRMTVEKESELDGDVARECISSADFDPELPLEVRPMFGPSVVWIISNDEEHSRHAPIDDEHASFQEPNGIHHTLLRSELQFGELFPICNILRSKRREFFWCVQRAPTTFCQLYVGHDQRRIPALRRPARLAVSLASQAMIRTTARTMT